jgi:hypothetical protein
MALNINIVNSTIIEVYQDSNPARYYFGALGTSGKFYPSGTSGVFSPQGLQVISDTLVDLVDGDYSNTTPIVNSDSGTPDVLLNIVVSSGSLILLGTNNSFSGYALGDTLTVQGSDLGGTGYLVYKIVSLDIDGLLIVIGGDDYEVKWDNLVVGGTSPTSLQDAQSLLSSLFSTL